MDHAKYKLAERQVERLTGNRLVDQLDLYDDFRALWLEVREDLANGARVTFDADQLRSDSFDLSTPLGLISVSRSFALVDNAIQPVALFTSRYGDGSSERTRNLLAVYLSSEVIWKDSIGNEYATDSYTDKVPGFRAIAMIRAAMAVQLLDETARCLSFGDVKRSSLFT